MLNSFALSVISLFTLAPVSGHMQVRSPPPRDSKFNPNVLEAKINYSLKSPVTKYGCNQFTKTAPVATYKAGEFIPFTFDGTASHNGGSCQFGLSYNGENFITLLDVMGDCLIGANSYNVPIPKDAPNGQAVAGWFWINKTGNREFYMNCVDISIEGGSDNGQLSGRSIAIANLEGYPTIPEGESGISLTENLYNKANTITISNNGASKVTNTPQEAKANADIQKDISIADKSKPESKPKVQATTIATSTVPIKAIPTVTKSIKPQFTQCATIKNDNSVCETGVIGCDEEGHLTLCSNNQLFRIPCAKDTKCASQEQVAYCI